MLEDLKRLETSARVGVMPRRAGVARDHKGSRRRSGRGVDKRCPRLPRLGTPGSRLKGSRQYPSDRRSDTKVSRRRCSRTPDARDVAQWDPQRCLRLEGSDRGCLRNIAGDARGSKDRDLSRRRTHRGVAQDVRCLRRRHSVTEGEARGLRRLETRDGPA